MLAHHPAHFILIVPLKLPQSHQLSVLRAYTDTYCAASPP
jgi:hypothetical protein